MYVTLTVPYVTVLVTTAFVNGRWANMENFISQLLKLKEIFCVLRWTKARKEKCAREFCIGASQRNDCAVYFNKKNPISHIAYRMSKLQWQADGIARRVDNRRGTVSSGYEISEIMKSTNLEFHRDKFVLKITPGFPICVIWAARGWARAARRSPACAPSNVRAAPGPLYILDVL
ncbi:hypothetical protein EVAR_74831_1 [Eumeta japonica]|uniref:Uncharacterized protein n=1 Tax=Eumeta variegata TaxID=151549 RepID=A0A4C1SSQ7_EUMVA|nr:hypothetical protein EVAR_74831_1 [Eumeta japonica]